jgi:cytochrome c5
VTRAAAAGALALALAACIPDPGPTMQPGRDCMECHASGAEEDDARPWTVAGTIAGRMGAHVAITDRNGWSFTLRSNRVGNFYTAEGVAFPLRVAVDGTPMPDALVDGSCNRCHVGGVGGAADTTDR